MAEAGTGVGVCTSNDDDHDVLAGAEVYVNINGIISVEYLEYYKFYCIHLLR